MSVTSQLGAPDINRFVPGKATLHRYHLIPATVAAPVTAVNMTDILEVTADPVTFAVNQELLQQGGGEEKINYQGEPSYNLKIKMYGRQVAAFMAAILNTTYSVAGYKARAHVYEDYPAINLESIFRLPNNLTHVGSKVYQELIPQQMNSGSAMGNQEVEVPFKSKYVPFELLAGYEMVLDKYTGDGSTTAFTLSSTPVPLWDATKGWNQQFLLDNVVYIKVWTSATAKAGTRQKSGVSVVGTALTFTTAPVAGEIVECFYAKAT